MSAAIESLADGLEAVAASVRRLASAHPDDWVDQYESPLGRRAHLRAVRSGKLAGFKVGAKVLVRRRDLDEYVEKHPVKPRGEKLSTKESEAAEAEAVLREIAERSSKSRKRKPSRKKAA